MGGGETGGEADGDAIALIRVPGAVCGLFPPACTPPFPDGVKQDVGVDDHRVPSALD